MGNKAQHVGEEDWKRTPVEEVIESAGLWSMRSYVRRQKATIAYYITIYMIF